MPISGPVLALDLAKRCGVAYGAPNVRARPESFTVVLYPPGKSPGRAVALGNFTDWLNGVLSGPRPALIVTEAPLPLAAFKSTASTEATVRLLYGLAGIVEALAQRHGVEHREIPVNAVRKHFIGKANLGSREATKLAVVSRCQVLGYIPRNCTDDNRADACALWDYTVARLGGSLGPLVLFGETAA